MRETRLSGSEGGGRETNRFSLPLSSLTLRQPARRLRDTRDLNPRNPRNPRMICVVVPSQRALNFP